MSKKKILNYLKAMNPQVEIQYAMPRRHKVVFQAILVH